MKKRTKKMVMLLFATFTGIAAISCSSDEFYGFDSKEDIELNILSVKNYQNYLELSRYDQGSEMSQSDFEILCEAESRLDFSTKKGLIIIAQTSGSEVNISEDLFKYIKNNYDHLNKIRNYSKQKAAKRVKRNNPEGDYNSKDHNGIAHSIAGTLSIPIEYVDSVLNVHFIEYRNGQGISPSNFLQAFQLIKTNAQERNTLYPFVSFSGGGTQITSLQSGIFNQNGYATASVKVQNTLTGNVWSVWYHDYLSGGVDHYFNITNEGNVVPTITTTGVTAIDNYYY